VGDAEQEGRALGVIWDGSGLGLDGTIWGSEFLLGDASEFTRIAALRPYPLLGGEAAARDPRRAALSLLAITFGVEVFEWADLPCVFAVAQAERKLLARLFESRVNCPLTSSMARLFDAVAALCGLVTRPGFEGRPGMLLESQVADVNVTPYPLPVVVNSDHAVGDVGRPRYWLEPRPLIENIVADVRRGVGPAVIAARFHVALVTSVIEVAHLVIPQFVVLSGGCFQNRLLTEGCTTQLRKNGLKAVIHRNLPPNDGGLSLGQALVARALQLNSSSAQPLK
jgi:hydrogenase maturation protein HypF